MVGQGTVRKKKMLWTTAAARIVSDQSAGRPIASPFELEGTNVAEQIAKTKDDAVLVLDTDGTCSPTTLVAVAQASGRDFLLGEKDTPENRDIFKACGLHAFVLAGTSRLFATNFEPTNLDVLSKVSGPADDYATQTFPGFRAIERLAGHEALGSLSETDLEALAKGFDIIHIDAIQKDAGVEERIVFGIVYEPGVVDSHKHFMKADELRKLAHGFMENSGVLGLQHSLQVNGKVKILESYITQFEGKIGDKVIKKGTWLMMARVVDDTIWKAVKDGTLTGFSFAGTGILVPRAAPTE